MQISLKILIGSMLLTVLSGCASSSDQASRRLVKLDAEPARDTDQARTLNDRAAQLIARSDFDGAEQLLKKAVTADAEFGPAQNNLGVVYYNESKPYPAAQQFLLAAALMPQEAAPRNGLGLVFEASNRFDDAISYYDRAVALKPSNMEYLGNSVRARIRRGDQNDQTRSMLTRLAAEDVRPDWNQWARETLNRMNRDMKAEHLPEKS